MVPASFDELKELLRGRGKDDEVEISVESVRRKGNRAMVILRLPSAFQVESRRFFGDHKHLAGRKTAGC